MKNHGQGADAGRFTLVSVGQRTDAESREFFVDGAFRDLRCGEACE